MKKFLALALAILMMAAIAVPAMAAEFTVNDTVVDFDDSIRWTETRYGDHNDESGADNYLTDANDTEVENTRLEYGVAQAYTVTIPADINLHEFHTDAEGGVADGKKDGYVYGIEKIGVSDVVIAGNEELNIYLSSSQYDAEKGGWRLMDAELNDATAGNPTNDKNNAAGPSDDVNYKITVKDITVQDGVDVVDANKYISNYDADRDDLITSGTGKEVATSRILNQVAATGNAGTTGSGKTAFLYFSSKGTAQEGTYRDVLTFTVKIETVVTES